MTDLSAAARRIVELASKATPGEWEAWAPEGDDELGRCLWSVCADGEDAHHCIATTRHKNDDQAYDNAAFIAHARNHAPALAADYLRLREVEKAARGVHGLHMSLTSMAAPREFYDALWALDAALAALNQHRSKKP